MLKKVFNIKQLIGVVLLVALLVLSHQDPYPVQYIREKTFDLYQLVKPRTLPAPEDRLVTIVDIDEVSLRKLGQWPWSRKIMAKLVANLHDMGAAVVAFDVVFSEPDRLNPKNLINSLEGLNEETLDKVRALESNDEFFAHTLSQSNVVLGRAGFWDKLPNTAPVLPKKAIAIRKLDINSPEPDKFLIEMPTLIGNLPLLEKQVNGIGVFAFKPVLDGVVRQVPVVNQHNGELYPSLAIEAIRVALQVPTLILEIEPNGVKGVGVAPRSLVKPDGLKIATDENGQVRPYFAPHDPDLYVSAIDILNRNVETSKVAGKIIFVGSSAIGLLDIRSTPVSFQIPGVEVHAQVVENALAIDRDLGAIVAAEMFLSRSQFVSKGVEIIIIALAGLLMLIVTPILGASWSLFIFFLLSSSAILGSWYLFTEKLILIDATFAVFTSFLLYSTLIYLGFTDEKAAKQQIRRAFSKYLSPDMVNVLSESPHQLKLGGQKRIMTLLFCDVRGFTTISEQFDAEGLTRLINKLLTPLSNIILSQKGTVDKYIGDCIMAFWNAPLDDSDHARNGCISALKMLEEMEPINKRLEKEAMAEGRPHIPLKVGMGLNSGECVVGNMGSDKRFDYSVLGDTVNLASRLEGQSKNYGVSIVIGEYTYAQVPELAVFELDKIRVKGKTQAVRIYGLIGDEKMAKTNEFKLLKSAVDAMLKKWREQKWIDTIQASKEAKVLGKNYHIDGLFELYEERANKYLDNPPDVAWDGVFVADTK
ncbi:MAG: adenylate/guanylate cyclase domain-containing protein [Gammaproteobacteria bacterium]|nr:adenylate/guanylate cyclase domain-containing protein [Gammaproteobacteria bacterium]